MEQVVNAVLDLVVPPASMVMLAFAWPTLSFLRGVEWVVKTLTVENMQNKVVLITGASSAIGEQIAYEYARRNANLVLVARREHRLFAVRENARALGAGQVLVIAADVVKEDDCRRLVGDTISFFGQLNHLVNTVSLGHDFCFEEAGDTVAFPHLMAAKAAVIDFYESLRYEVGDEFKPRDGNLPRGAGDPPSTRPYGAGGGYKFHPAGPSGRGPGIMRGRGRVAIPTRGYLRGPEVCSPVDKNYEKEAHKGLNYISTCVYVYLGIRLPRMHITTNCAFVIY
ncbi:hypothetical protein OsI_14269 [Oryza sativa Indica Group]|uniref:Uncharacterized protein n=1 Tax=Oryza sativa subsp. indica TaxID=39946 RepID=A2XNX1_ORYSI|nr:hypothetical protein OsI_14269 [Oryza sativa Indica Group]